MVQIWVEDRVICEARTAGHNTDKICHARKMRLLILRPDRNIGPAVRPGCAIVIATSAEGAAPGLRGTALQSRPHKGLWKAVPAEFTYGWNETSRNNVRCYEHSKI
jgi:hypothetical protein